MIVGGRTVSGLLGLLKEDSNCFWRMFAIDFLSVSRLPYRCQRVGLYFVLFGFASFFSVAEKELWVILYLTDCSHFIFGLLCEGEFLHTFHYNFKVVFEFSYFGGVWVNGLNAVKSTFQFSFLS